MSVRFNSHMSDIELFRDKCFIKFRDITHKMNEKNVQEIKKIGQHIRQHGDFREVWILAGNDVNDFDFVFKDNHQIRTLDTNMDLTKMDNFEYENVWLLDLHDVEVTNDHLQKWNQNFPNTRLMCVHEHNENGLTDDQKTQIKQVMKHVDTAQECKKF